MRYWTVMNMHILTHSLENNPLPIEYIIDHCILILSSMYGCTTNSQNRELLELQYLFIRKITRSDKRDSELIREWDIVIDDSFIIRAAAQEQAKQ